MCNVYAWRDDDMYILLEVQVCSGIWHGCKFCHIVQKAMDMDFSYHILL